MKLLKKMGAVLTAAFLFCTVSVNAMAAREELDLTKKGQITVTIKDTDTKEPVSGGSLKLYQVASVKKTGADLTFEYTAAFSGCTQKLNDLGIEKLAEKINDYVKKQNISGQEVQVSEAGQAVFSDLPLGLYLIEQGAVNEKYTSVSPFLVTVPVSDKDGYIYEVDASPKAGTVNPLTTPAPTETVTPTPTIPGGNLPQTGQLWWPVPLLLAVGCVLVIFGVVRKNAANK